MHFSVLLSFDEIFSTHAEVSLVKVNDTRGRVFDVGGNGEIKEVIGAVALRAEFVVELTPVEQMLICFA